MGIQQFKKHALYPGVFLGFTLVILEFSALFLGLLFHKYLANIFTIIVFFSISIAIKKYRDYNNGYLKFSSAFKIGFVTCVISGAIWSIYRYIEYKLSPSILEEIIRANKEALSESWATSDRLEFMMEATEKVTTPATLAFLNTFIVSMILGGSILSLFLAFILKRENPDKKQKLEL